MNEKIKELAEQAGAELYGEQDILVNGKDAYDFVENFARLIVRECAKFLDENSGYDDANNAWHPEPEELLEHFGVE